MALQHVDPPRIQASALTTLISDKTPANAVHVEYLHELALHILHNLRYQHRWTNLRIHTISPLSGLPLPRPLVSGLPPKRLYTHPDEQAELLQAAATRAKEAKQSRSEHVADAGSEKGDDDESFVQSEEEWALPTHLRERWSLRRFSEVFDGITMTPPEANQNDNKWRTNKRLLMATAQDDSTIVYYIVHDGIVKPRQN